jgi:aromatic ring hydroxylase
MPIRTGRAFLDSLRDDRQLWIDGERVVDVVTDRRFAAAAQSVAELYDMQHDPTLLQRMTYLAPESGDRAGRSFIQPRSIDDLISRREMVKVWMDATSRSRIKLFRRAFDAAVSSFAGRQQLYERYYSGDPVRLAGMLFSLYDRNEYMQRISQLLDSLEARTAAT